MFEVFIGSIIMLIGIVVGAALASVAHASGIKKSEDK